MREGGRKGGGKEGGREGGRERESERESEGGMGRGGEGGKGTLTSPFGGLRGPPKDHAFVTLDISSQRGLRCDSNPEKCVEGGSDQSLRGAAGTRQCEGRWKLLGLFFGDVRDLFWG